MPEGFRYPDVAALWTLFQFDPASQERAHNFEVVARLKGETTFAQARAAMEVAGAALKRASPGLMGDDETVTVRPLRDCLYRGHASGVSPVPPRSRRRSCCWSDA